MKQGELSLGAVGRDVVVTVAADGAVFVDERRVALDAFAVELRAALARIEDGTYGTCVRCGAVISAERLDVLPATPFCRHCAR
mgnify:CR=1 FL=1